MIIITDGLSNINPEATIPEAELAKEQGVHIFAVGVGVQDPWELNAIASKPTDKNVFQVNDWEDLWNLPKELIDRTCKGMILVKNFKLYNDDSNDNILSECVLL